MSDAASVQIECSNCQRAFELDAGRLQAAQVADVRCICGERLQAAAASNNPLRLGKYTLVNRIAVGGMGEIFYAKVSGVEGFEKEVAIKRMLPHLSNDRDFVNMMVKEAKLTVLLNHPNIVGVYDLARQADAYYIAMEYVPGVTVGNILEKTVGDKDLLPPAVAIHIASQVLRGLSYAHNLPTPAGEQITILHRDITPQNILVTRQAYVKITDFGIAKAVNEITTTSAGMIKGKLGYLAPEQLEGREPDQRIDLFCAAILLWEMLMSRRLFKGNSEIDTFRLISECKIPPLSEARQDVSPQIEAVLRRALDRDPDKRFLQADAFNSALAQAIAPQTQDDLAQHTRQYFNQHPDYFAGIAAHKVASLGDQSTRNIAVPGAARPPVDAKDLASVTAFLRLPTESPIAAAPLKPRSGRRWAYVALSVAVLTVTFGLWFYPRLVERRDVPTIGSHAPDDEHSGEALAEADPTVSQAAPANANLPGPAAPGTPSAAPVAPPVAAPTPAMSPPPSTAPAGPEAKRPPPRHEPPARPLTGKEIQATVQRHQPNIARCLGDIDTTHAPGKVDAQITIDAAGHVSQVIITPQVGQPAVDRCLVRSLKVMRFHRHTSPELKVTIPLKIQVL